MEPKQTLRDQMLALRHREREIEDELRVATETLQAELEANRSEQRRIKHLLVTDVRTNVRLPTTGPRAGRRVMAELGTFTMGFMRSRLGWDLKEVKKLIQVMECETPPAIERRGRFGGQQVFEYVGPPIEEDPEAERAEVEYQRLRTWALAQTTTFTPAQGAAACQASKSSALRAFRRQQEVGALVDKGPTRDMPLFAVAGTPAADPAPSPALAAAPAPAPAPEPELFSKIPQVQELLAAADRSGLTVTTTGRYHAVENLEGDRVVFETNPPNREAMLALRGKIRQLGAKL